MSLIIFCLLIVLCSTSTRSSITITTIAGNDNNENVDGIGTLSSFYNLVSGAADFNYEYIVVVEDTYSTDAIRMIDLSTLMVSTISTGRVWNHPLGIVAFPDGFFVSNTRDCTIIMIIEYNNRNFLDYLSVGQSQVCSTIDDVGEFAAFDYPTQMTYVVNSNYVYVLDSGSGSVRRIDFGNSFETITIAILANSVSIASDQTYIFAITSTSIYYAKTADYNTVRAPLTLTLLVSGFADFHYMSISTAGNFYICDGNKILIAGVDTASSYLLYRRELESFGYPFEGYSDGDVSDALFNHTSFIILSQNQENLYIGDTGNHRLRLIDCSDCYLSSTKSALSYVPSIEVSTVAGSGNEVHADGIGLSASFRNINAGCMDWGGSYIIVVEGVQSYQAVRMMMTATGEVTTIANGR